MKLIQAIGAIYFLAVNLQIFFETSSLNRANNVPKLPGVNYVVKNSALAMMFKALPLVHFWSILFLKEQIMMTSVRKMLKALVWSAQNQSIFSEICPENNHRIRHFFTNRFSAKFVFKIPVKLADSSTNLSLKILQNLTFFRDLSEALLVGELTKVFKKTEISHFATLFETRDLIIFITLIHFISLGMRLGLTSFILQYRMCPCITVSLNLIFCCLQIYGLRAWSQWWSPEVTCGSHSSTSVSAHCWC